MASYDIVCCVDGFDNGAVASLGNQLGCLFVPHRFLVIQRSWHQPLCYSKLDLRFLYRPLLPRESCLLVLCH